jgi:outer membrane protein TolC
MKKTMSRRLLVSIACIVMSETTAFAAEEQRGLDERLAPPPGGGLTSDQVAARAQQTSFDAAAQREAILSAETRVEQARAAYIPKLTLTGRYTRLSPITQSFPLPTGNPTMMPGMMSSAAPTQNFDIPVQFDILYFQAGLNIPLSDYVLRLSHNLSSASRSRRASTFDEQATKLKAALDGRQAYYAWLRARAQVIVAERSLEQARGHLEDARHAFDVGTSSKADVLRVESQVANGELVLEQTKNLAVLTEEQIRTAMHDPSALPYAIGEDLRADMPPSPTENIASLESEAMDRRLEVRALDETALSLRDQAKSAQAGNWPRLDGFGDVFWANPNPRYFVQDRTFHATWDVGVQLVWSPSDALNAGPQVRDAQHRANQIELQKAALRDSIKIQVLQAYQALKEAEVAVQTAKRGLASAEEGYRVRRELFRNGRATTVELLDSQADLTRESINSVNARANLLVAKAALDHATGRDIPPGFATR